MISKKLLSKFPKSGAKISRILETNFKFGEKNNLPYWEGLHTIKLDSLKKQEESNKWNGGAEISDRTVFRGYLESSDANAIHFISNRKKVIKTISGSFYHAFADDFAEIIFVSNIYPKVEFIFDISEIQGSLDSPSYEFFAYFLECLDKKKIKYTLVDLKKFDVLYINNFYHLVIPFESGARLDLLADFFKDFVTDKNQKPYKKVYVSRARLAHRQPNENAKNFYYSDDNRIDDHTEIEKIFLDMGFEIICPEDFSSFQEQLDYFYSVKTLASLTSSGIANALFMQPGGNLVELVTPLLTVSPVIDEKYFRINEIDVDSYDQHPEVVHEIHMFYHSLAFFKEHTYIGIPNSSRKARKIRDFIDKNLLLKAMLTDE